MEGSSRQDDSRQEQQASSRTTTPPDAPTTRSALGTSKSDRSRTGLISDGDQQQHVRSWLPPIHNATTSEYLSQHHSLRPTVRGSSAYIKRHYAARGMLPGQARSEMLRNDEVPGRPGPAVRSAILAALAVNAELLPARIEREPEVEAAQLQWSTTSVGDLEALDSILDQLVVKDHSMREALLKGPLISFETVVPNPMSNSGRPFFQPDQEYKDETFITGVQGVEEVAGEQLEDVALPPEPQPEPAPVSMPAPIHDTPAVAPPPSYARAARAIQEAAVVDEYEAMRESIPIPILPKLARAYITHKPSTVAKVPPLPPPTAEYLVKTRPAAVIAAPSYDELCSHIRDVQRQYTCGTAKDKPPTNPVTSMQNNANMYISGLDGPALDDMVNYEELPVGLERSRPSFVAMKKGTGKSVKTGRSASRERSARRSPGVTQWEVTGEGR